MKFIVQTVNNEIVHHFSFTLKESINYRNWYYGDKEDIIIYTNDETPEFIKDACPVGSVEFVSDYLTKYYNKTPKPINIPECLYPFADRKVWVGDENDYKENCFIKSHDTIKKFPSMIIYDDNITLDKGVYQYSDLIDIDSEWRCFVYNNKLVGLQNYSGDFTLFPNIRKIHEMISVFKPDAPITYTLDVGVNALECNGIEDTKTFVIEIHDFFSCGLYGFADLNILPLMFYRWFKNFIKDTV